LNCARLRALHVACAAGLPDLGDPRLGPRDEPWRGLGSGLAAVEPVFAVHDLRQSTRKVSDVAQDEVIARLHAVAHEYAPVTDEDLETKLRAARAEIAQLKVAVDHRTIIGRAVGILMERHHIDSDTAFTTLVRASSTTNRRLYDLAKELVETGRSGRL
jgi:hypothetical protein